ncbi:MAG: hypothetical protein K8R13_08800 [Methanococcoides sp.]|nr:hypothetical protein [Methanococcoides sp.]
MIRYQQYQRLGFEEEKFNEKRITVSGSYLVVTGLSRNPNIVFEASARIGKMESAQIPKIMNNALKMLFVENYLGQTFRKILVFIDEEAASKFVDDGWHGECLRRYNIEVMVLDVSDDVKKDIIEAQKRQYR